jgi:hypothetical protein
VGQRCPVTPRPPASAEECPPKAESDGNDAHDETNDHGRLRNFAIGICGQTLADILKKSPGEGNVRREQRKAGSDGNHAWTWKCQHQHARNDHNRPKKYTPNTNEDVPFRFGDRFLSTTRFEFRLDCGLFEFLESFAATLV